MCVKVLCSAFLIHYEQLALYMRGVSICRPTYMVDMLCLRQSGCALAHAVFVLWVSSHFVFALCSVLFSSSLEVWCLFCVWKHRFECASVIGVLCIPWVLWNSWVQYQACGREENPWAISATDTLWFPCPLHRGGSRYVISAAPSEARRSTLYNSGHLKSGTAPWCSLATQSSERSGAHILRKLGSFLLHILGESHFSPTLLCIWQGS